jgi:hypothetical protein
VSIIAKLKSVDIPENQARDVIVALGQWIASELVSRM